MTLGKSYNARYIAMFVIFFYTGKSCVHVKVSQEWCRMVNNNNLEGAHIYIQYSWSRTTKTIIFK